MLTFFADSSQNLRTLYAFTTSVVVVKYSVLPLSDEAFDLRVDEAVDLYIRAMKYDPSIRPGRKNAWVRHHHEPHWSAVVAIAHPEEVDAQDALMDPSYPLVGVAYATRGHSQQWWHSQVRGGLAAAGWRIPQVYALMHNYAELSEIHVDPRAQGHGLGEAMLRALLATRTEAYVLLSTPEVPGEANRAWRLYRRLDFEDVLRDFHFNGDSRPFAVLGARLPLNS